MSKTRIVTNDPENYIKMSEPFESPENANEALSEFHKEVSDLRKKYKITDVVIITKGSVKYPDGKIGEFMNHSSFGATMNVEPMTAYAYGQASADRREMINKFISGTK